MLAQQQWHARTVALAGLLSVALVGLPYKVSAQAQERPSPVVDVIKGVVFDPTTYAPATIAYYATMRDWNTSQPFFERGAVEGNARFTVSGLPNDTPISYANGNRKILSDALVNLEVSAISNLASRAMERVLIERYPEHRKLVRTLGWVQRIGLSSYLAYSLSIQHFRQTQLNEQLARQYGF